MVSVISFGFSIKNHQEKKSVDNEWEKFIKRPEIKLIGTVQNKIKKNKNKNNTE